MSPASDVKLAVAVTQPQLPELDALERIIELGAAWLETRVVCNAQCHASMLCAN